MIENTYDRWQGNGVTQHDNALCRRKSDDWHRRETGGQWKFNAPIQGTMQRSQVPEWCWRASKAVHFADSSQARTSRPRGTPASGAFGRDCVRCGMAMLVLPDVFERTWSNRAPLSGMRFLWVWMDGELEEDG